MCFLRTTASQLHSCIKILKKHDKQFPLLPMRDPLRCSASICFINFEALVKIKAQQKRLYAKVFCSGDIEIARAELLLKRDKNIISSAEPFC